MYLENMSLTFSIKKNIIQCNVISIAISRNISSNHCSHAISR